MSVMVGKSVHGLHKLFQILFLIWTDIVKKELYVYTGIIQRINIKKIHKIKFSPQKEDGYSNKGVRTDKTFSRKMKIIKWMLVF